MPSFTISFTKAAACTYNFFHAFNLPMWHGLRRLGLLFSGWDIPEKVSWEKNPVNYIYPVQLGQFKLINIIKMDDRS